MLFGALIHRAQESVDTVIAQTLNRVIIGVPFVIAGGFGTAALWIYLEGAYGALIANLALTALFVLVGLVLALSLNTGASASAGADATDSSTGTGHAPGAADEAPSKPMSAADRELLMTTLTTAAPIALPGLLRILLRNLPLLAVIAAVAFLISRSVTGGADSEPDAAAEVPPGAAAA